MSPVPLSKTQRLLITADLGCRWQASPKKPPLPNRSRPPLPCGGGAYLLPGSTSTAPKPIPCWRFMDLLLCVEIWEVSAAMAVHLTVGFSMRFRPGRSC